MIRDDLRQIIQDYIKSDVICVVNWKRGEDGVSCLDLIHGIKYSEKNNLDEIRRSLTNVIGKHLDSFEALFAHDGDGVEVWRQLPFGSLKEILINCKEKIDTRRSSHSKRKLNTTLYKSFYAWYKNNETVCSEEEEAELLERVTLELFPLIDLITLVKPEGMFPEDEVDERICNLAAKFDRMVREEENDDGLDDNDDLMLREEDEDGEEEIINAENN